MKKYDVKDHAPSLLPDGMEFELVWSDEFDGDTLDSTKWDYRLCMMGKRHPAWTDKGVKIENGCAVFSIFEENGELMKLLNHPKIHKEEKVSVMEQIFENGYRRDQNFLAR